MKIKEVNKLEPGLYEIFWKNKYGGGFSLGVIGSQGGYRWFHTSESNMYGARHNENSWNKVKSVNLLYLQSIISTDTKDE